MDDDAIADSDVADAADARPASTADDGSDDAATSVARSTTPTVMARTARDRMFDVMAPSCATQPRDVR
jgi:hypothetical protein